MNVVPTAKLTHREQIARSRRDKVASSSRIVQPVARALALLGAFTPSDRWLTNSELVLRTGLPASTVFRLTKCLVTLGYLRYSAERRRYCLCATVLALGYAAIVQSSVQRVVQERMVDFCEQYRTHLILSRRERLNLIVIETCSSRAAGTSLKFTVGECLDLASTPMGWALLAVLPEAERYCLLGSIEQRSPRDWPRLRRCSIEAISQVLNVGYCLSLCEWNPKLAIIATPLLIDGYAPLVLTCVGAASQVSRARVERELGPKLTSIAAAIAKEVIVPQ